MRLATARYGSESGFIGTRCGGRQGRLPSCGDARRAGAGSSSFGDTEIASDVIREQRRQNATPPYPYKSSYLLTGIENFFNVFNDKLTELT
jgi:hypothetical protein